MPQNLILASNQFDALCPSTFTRLYNWCNFQVGLTLAKGGGVAKIPDRQIMFWRTTQFNELNKRILYAKGTIILQCQKHCTVAAVANTLTARLSAGNPVNATTPDRPQAVQPYYEPKQKQ